MIAPTVITGYLVSNSECTHKIRTKVMIPTGIATFVLFLFVKSLVFQGFSAVRHKRIISLWVIVATFHTLRNYKITGIMNP